MPGLSVGAIDRKTGIPGFGEALVTVGWIQDTPDGIMLERFDEHNGASAKQRAQTAKRVANHKSNASVTPISQNANAPTVTSALPREEKRREEKKEESPTSVKTPAEKSKTATGSRLPEDWRPNIADLDYCKTERPDLLPSRVAQNFYDYWIAKPGAAGRKLDWSATWRTWVRKESASTAGRPAAGAVRPSQLSSAEQNKLNSQVAMRMLGISEPNEGVILDAE